MVNVIVHILLILNILFRLEEAISAEHYFFVLILINSLRVKIFQLIKFIRRIYRDVINSNGIK